MGDRILDRNLMWENGFFGARETQLLIEITESALNVNLRSLADAAGYNPAIHGTVHAIVAPGVVIGSSSTAVASMVTGAFYEGTTLKLTVNGSIQGKPGKGGAGGSVSGVWAAFTAGAGAAGAAGGPAMSLGHDIVIANSSGQIFGGGGGGGGGGSGWWIDGLPSTRQMGGGGGGAGAGHQTTTGGAGGVAGGTDAEEGPTYRVNGSAGGTGSSSGAGAGGAGGIYATVFYGGNGGAGGAWGSPGAAGSPGSPSTNYASGGSGGAAGKAISLNGYAVTWLSGNDSTHVKGAVS